jgi:hypothetical protein
MQVIMATQQIIAIFHRNHKQKSSLLFHNMQWTNAVVHYSVTDFEKHFFLIEQFFFWQQREGG